MTNVPIWNNTTEQKETHPDILEWAMDNAKPGEDLVIDRCPHCKNPVVVYIDRYKPLSVPAPKVEGPPDLL